MRTVRLWIAYDGTEYAGWQRQAAGDTIQEEIEGAFRALVGSAVTVHGAGRTDAGVHALSQCAHVQIDRGPPTERLHLALNTMLPRDIRVLGAVDAE
ncbi:MAG: tRNA pseudouridine(38-40) synthase TruA, partial [Planctomycetes bacterium]|nr:tRNA pseudouridine(38-40) synthase TruA [Planctomycetota bacterium]